MKVLKKDNRIQEFQSNKIKVSILNATNSEKSLLNEADIKIIVSDIEKKLKEIRGEDGITSSYEIIGTIISVLNNDKFYDVISSFVGYEDSNIIN